LTVADTAHNLRVLLDTNLLILYLIGSTNRDRIGRFKRTQNYTIEDFDLLVQVLSGYRQYLTTPHILTQVDDLVKLEEPEYGAFLELFRSWIGGASESIASAIELVRDPMFFRVGFADTGIGKAAEQGTDILTDDLNLYLVYCPTNN
jgi:hypothetical protein